MTENSAQSARNEAILAVRNGTLTDNVVNRVTLSDGRRVLWGSREHVTELRLVWLKLTPSAQESVRKTFPLTVQLLTY